MRDSSVRYPAARLINAWMWVLVASTRPLDTPESRVLRMGVALWE
jgi:hypothetical protein